MRSFIEELRHRNVFRVAIAYAVVGWLLAQVTDLVVDAFNLASSDACRLLVCSTVDGPGDSSTCGSPDCELKWSTQHIVEFVCRTTEPQRLSGSLVQLQSDLVEFGL